MHFNEDMIYKTLLSFVVTLFYIEHTRGHPQCLDYRPPFSVQGGLQFCDEYQDFGCCSRQDDDTVRQQAEYVTNLLIHNGATSCLSNVKTILCQQCSPFAAHIFDAERTQQARPFPGLCYTYSSQFYNDCQNYIRHFTNDSMLINANSFDDFYSLTAIPDLQYCYPDILTNTDLNKELDRTQISEDGCLCLETFTSGLANPLIFRSPPDQSDRIFVGLQKGIIYIYNGDGIRINDQFMDLTDDVLSSPSSGDERGLLGMAFHPNFKSNRQFYLYYTTRISGVHHVRLSEFKESNVNPNKVDLDSQRIVLDIREPYSNHNGGEILFGTDGYLYIFVGDGGAGGDPYGYAQNKDSLLGKVLRLDVDYHDSDTAYRIPDDNPFKNEVDAKPEIYAYGIRNIWRCDMDEGDSVTGAGRGRIICGDVGQSRYEEIDIIVNGGNYGWNIREGESCYRNNVDLCRGTLENEELPIHVYDHSVGQSVTGGSVYRGCENPNLNGLYFFGDFVNGKLFRLKENPTNNTWSVKDVNMCGPDLCFNGLTYTYPRYLLSFGEDYNGEVYILSTPNPSSTRDVGSIYKLVDPRVRGDPASCRSAIWDRPPVTPTTPMTTTTDPTTTSMETVSSGSSGDKLDIVFVIDSSGSVTRLNYYLYLLRSISEVLSAFPIGDSGFRVGTVLFGANPRFGFKLDEYTSQSSLNTALQRLPFLDESTHTASGIRMAREMIFNSDTGGNRDDAPDLIVVLTDGPPTVNADNALPEADQARQQGIDVMVVAARIQNNVDIDEIRQIANTPYDDYFIQVDEFTDLIRSTYVNNAIGKIRRIISNSPSLSSSTPLSTSSTRRTSLSSATTTDTTTTSTTTTETTTTSTTTTTTLSTTTTDDTDFSGDLFTWTCDFESKSGEGTLCGMVQDSNDDFDWQLRTGGTPSDPTGPDVAYSGLYYLYIETSNPRKENDTAVIYLPSFGERSGPHCLQFHYHMYGFHIRELQFIIKPSNDNQIVVWYQRYEKGNLWMNAAITIYLSPVDTIGFVGIRGAEYSGDIAIDFIVITNGEC